MKKLALTLITLLALTSCSYDDTYNQTIIQEKEQKTIVESFGYLNTLVVGKIVSYNRSLNNFNFAEGIIAGTAINSSQLSPAYHIRKIYGSGNNIIRITFQLQIRDGGFTKTIDVELNQENNNVTAKITNAWHSLESSFTTDFDSLTAIFWNPQTNNWSSALVSGTKRPSGIYNGLTSISGYGCNYIKLTFN